MRSVTYNCGEFRARVEEKHARKLKKILELFTILRAENDEDRIIELSSCGCRADEIRKALASAGIPFEDLSTPPSMTEDGFGVRPELW